MTDTQPDKACSVSGEVNSTQKWTFPKATPEGDVWVILIPLSLNFCFKREEEEKLPGGYALRMQSQLRCHSLPWSIMGFADYN